MGVRCVLLCGRSGSGKTHLIERLVREFGSRGLRVGVLKHAFHEFEADREGKDTWRFARAGARQVGIASGSLFWTYRSFPEPPPLEALVRYYDGVDILLVEGYKRSPHPKIEVTNGSSAADLECLGDARLLAVAGVKRVDCGVPFFDRDDERGIADFILDTVPERVSTDGGEAPAK
ncbi:MAG: molybdopterin-guanine dinucleotide biosynthesis protein B [Firmicutes bacterium]|jgi:molybdopterin-guanine dinucleotide biosynthesis protein MobB|nr:molybdopterin-guanine dinucleotide biosynthesis protein B [Bacillota bacterium]